MPIYILDSNSYITCGFCKHIASAQKLNMFLLAYDIATFALCSTLFRGHVYLDLIYPLL